MNDPIKYIIMDGEITILIGIGIAIILYIIYRIIKLILKISANATREK